MLITSHFAATLLLVKGLSLSTSETLAALAGGVFLDADHIFANKKWISDVKNFFSGRGVTHGEVKQHSWTHEPLTGIPAGIVFGLLLSYSGWDVRWWIFPFFQTLHIVMDALMRYDHQPLRPLSYLRYRVLSRQIASVN